MNAGDGLFSYGCCWWTELQSNSHYWMAHLKVAPTHTMLLCHVPVYILLS